MHQELHLTNAETRPADRQKECLGIGRLTFWKRRPNLEVRLERGDGRATERDHALFVSLADHPHAPLYQIDVAEVESRKLGNAQARSVENFQHRAVALSDRLLSAG